MGVVTHCSPFIIFKVNEINHKNYSISATAEQADRPGMNLLSCKPIST